MTSTNGHHFARIENNNSTAVLGNIIAHGEVTINSKTATSTNVTGYAQTSLRPVSTYIVRPALYEQLKTRLHETLDIRDIVSKIVVVCGLGGAGKSQLVLHYIQQHRQDYSAVFWIETGSKTTVERDFIQIWRLLHDSREENINIDDAVRGIKAWFQQQKKTCLLVFDSADSIDDERGKDYIDLAAFLPDAAHVDIIVTTRSQTAQGMTEIDAVQVGDLEEEEALNLLLRCSKITADENTRREAALIVKELGYFALAVALAGAYIAVTPRIRTRLETYLPEYRQQRKTLLGRKPQRLVHRYGESVLTTWETSYDAIAGQLPEALGLLHLLAFLNPDDIFYELFAPLLDVYPKRAAAIWGGMKEVETNDDVVTQNTLDSALEVLSKYSLVSWKEEQNSYVMHKLVNTWGYERLANEEQLKYSQEVLGFIGGLLTYQSYGPAMKTRLVPHIMACFSRLQEQVAVTQQMQKQSLVSLGVCSYFLLENGQFIQGVEICQLKCKASRHLYSDNEVVVSRADHALAQMYVRQGRYKDAEELLVRVVEIEKRVLGEEDPNTALSVNNLALTYRNQGRYKDAEELCLKVVEIKKRVFGDEHPGTLVSLNNLALTYRNQGRYKDAEELCLKVVEIRKRVLGEEHPYTLVSLNNLALTYLYQGRHEDAEELQVKVVDIRNRVLGEEHPETLISLNNLAVTYRNQGRYKNAEELLVRVVEIEKRVLGEKHPSTLMSIQNLAVIFLYQRRLQEALDLMQQCVQSRGAVLGEEHPDTVNSVGWLTTIKMEMQDNEQTEVDLSDLDS